MNALEIGMIVLGGIVLVLGIIIVVVYFRGIAAAHGGSNSGHNPNDIIMLLKSKNAGPAMTPSDRRKQGQTDSLNSLASFQMAQTDQEKLDALLRMRAMCDAPEDDTHMAMSHQVEPEDVPASKQMRNMQMFSGLENEEEDALLLELDGVVPPDHARPHLGVDRDVRGDANASRMFRDGFATPTRTPTGTPAGTRSRLRASEQLARVSTDWHDSSTPPSTKRRYVQPPQGYPSSWSGGHEHATPPRLSQSARPPARGDGAAQRSPTRGGSWTDGPRGGSHVSPPAGANSRERPPSRGPVAPTASNTARARPPSRGPPASAHRPGPSSSARVSAAGERRLRPLSSLGLDPSKAAHMVAVDYSSSSDDGSRSPTPTTML